jgi:hypothetical protein
MLRRIQAINEDRDVPLTPHDKHSEEHKSLGRAKRPNPRR